MAELSNPNQGLKIPGAEQSLEQLIGYLGEVCNGNLAVSGFRVGHLVGFSQIKTRCQELLRTHTPELAIKQLMIELDKCYDDFHGGDW